MTRRAWSRSIVMRYHDITLCLGRAAMRFRPEATSRAGVRGSTVEDSGRFATAEVLEGACSPLENEDRESL